LEPDQASFGHIGRGHRWTNVKPSPVQLLEPIPSGGMLNE
jgi:hypothetical protein